MTPGRVPVNVGATDKSLLDHEHRCKTSRPAEGHASCSHSCSPHRPPELQPSLKCPDSLTKPKCGQAAPPGLGLGAARPFRLVECMPESAGPPPLPKVPVQLTGPCRPSTPLLGPAQLARRSSGSSSLPCMHLHTRLSAPTQNSS